MPRWERWLSIAAYRVWMILPHWLAFSKLGFAMLPWVGNYAYRCFCPADLRVREFPGVQHG